MLSERRINCIRSWATCRFAVESPVELIGKVVREFLIPAPDDPQTRQRNVFGIRDLR